MPSYAWHACEIKIGWLASRISCDWTLPGNIRPDSSSFMAIGIFNFPVVIFCQRPVNGEVALRCIHSGFNPKLGPLSSACSPGFSMTTRVASVVDDGRTPSSVNGSTILTTLHCFFLTMCVPSATAMCAVGTVVPTVDPHMLAMSSTLGPSSRRACSLAAIL